GIDFLDSNSIKDFIVPFVSILTFIMSILSLTITSIVNRKRIIPSKIKCLMKYHRIKFTPGGTEYNRKGIYLIIDISNPSPHNIGLNNFTFYNDNCEQLYIETGYQFKHIFLDNLV